MGTKKGFISSGEIMLQSYEELKEAYENLQKQCESLREEYDELNNRTIKMFQMASEETDGIIYVHNAKKQMNIANERVAALLKMEPIQKGVPYEMVRNQYVSRDTRGEYIRIHEEIFHGAKEALGAVRIMDGTPGGTVYEMKLRTVMDNNGHPSDVAVVTMIDITDTYEQKKELIRYKKIMEANEAYTFEYDEGTDTLLIVMPSATNPFKKAYPDFTKALYTGVCCEKEDIPLLEKSLKGIAREPVHVKMRDRKGNGYHWFSISIITVEYVNGMRKVAGTIMDIEDIKRKEQAAQELEDIVRTFTDDYLAVYKVDLVQDTYEVLKTSPEMARYMVPDSGSYSEANKMYFCRFAAGDYQGICQDFGELDNLRRSLATERSIEMEYMTPLGYASWRRTIFRCLEYKREQPVRAIMYVCNIDQYRMERMRIQKEIEDAKKAFEISEAANLAKTDFLSRMSHDIRTPMNAIIGMTSIATTYIDNRDRVTECLKKIAVASKHLLSLINEVLDMSRIESGKTELVRETFSFEELMDNVITLVRPQLKEHAHQLELTIDTLDHESVIGDVQHLQQVLVNLMSNAIKYTPDGGLIRISVTENQIDSQRYGEFDIVIEDNGIGMSEDFLKVLFDPFTRAEDPRVGKVSGTGLGMAITRNLVQMMDGNIQVESELNKGTRIVLTMHLQLIEAEDIMLRHLKNKLILIVDDDQDSCESAAVMLRSIGVRTEYCLSGREAMAKVLLKYDSDDKYFAIFVDWKMPELDGGETMREIRRLSGKDLPLIVLTSCDWSTIEAEAVAAGANGYLKKPLEKLPMFEQLKSFLPVDGVENRNERGFLDDSETLDLTETRVLVVEDDELNAEILIELLDMMGVTSELATNGKEAVDLFEASEEEYYDLILMDIQMPVMNGYEATTAIREMKRKDADTVPIIALSANVFVSDRKRSTNSGMNEHLSKPIEPEQLQRILNKYRR